MNDASNHHHDGDGISTGLILGAVIIVIFLLLILFGGRFFQGTGNQQTQIPAPQSESQSEGGEGGDIKVEIPEKVDINYEGPTY